MSNHNNDDDDANEDDGHDDHETSTLMGSFADNLFMSLTTMMKTMMMLMMRPIKSLFKVYIRSMWGRYMLYVRSWEHPLDLIKNARRRGLGTASGFHIKSAVKWCGFGGPDKVRPHGRPKNLSFLFKIL